MRVESQVVDVLQAAGRAILRVKFRVTGSEIQPADWVDVSVSARVFPFPPGNSLGTPLAEGPEVSASARTDWRLIDLELPLMPFAQYVVQGKVLMRDSRFRGQDFSPSECYAGQITYGFDPNATPT